MTQFQRLAVFVALAAIGYAGCGRSDLDEGFPTEPITDGSGGTGIGTGTGGQVGTGSGGRNGTGTGGSGGQVGTGSGGRNGTGTGGRNGTGGTGGNVGGTGGRVGSGGSGGSGGRTGTGGSVTTGTGASGGTGTGGSGGTGGSPGGIACGEMTCALGTQTCCVQTVNGVRIESCLNAGTQCAGGNIGCVAGDCTDGRLCCLSIVGLATACATPTQCTDGLSTVLCRNNGDCPADRRFCCPSIGINICRNYRCPGN